MEDLFNYNLSSNTIIFTDTLTKKTPYISLRPRNHESIFFVTKGTGVYEKNGVETIIPKGNVGYISKGSIDKSSSFDDEGFSYIAVNFNFDNNNKIPKATLPFETVCGTKRIEYEHLFTEALNTFIEKRPGYIAICNGFILQIIGLIYREMHVSYQDAKNYDNIENAIDYIKLNYADNELKISTLSSICNMSERNMRRIFLNLYNETPYAYLQNFRINKAKIFLRHSSESVNSIAYKCGFSDIYSFSHAFKNCFGISPTEYRNGAF